MANEKIKEFFEIKAKLWKSTVDDKWLEAILRKYGIKEGSKVVDIGCGKGIISNIIHKISQNKVVCIDFCQGMINGAKQNHQKEKDLEFVCQDFYEYHSNNLFDYAIFFNSYPHFLDKEGLKNKLDELLASNGKILIIHDMAMDDIDAIHKRIDNDLFCDLALPNVEASHFLPKFVIEDKSLQKDSYILVLKRAK